MVDATDGVNPGGTIYQATAYSRGDYDPREDDFSSESGFYDTDGFTESDDEFSSDFATSEELFADNKNIFSGGQFDGYGLIYLTDEKKYLLNGKECQYKLLAADDSSGFVNANLLVGESYGDIELNKITDSGDGEITLQSKKIQLVDVTKVAAGTNIYKFDSSKNLVVAGQVGS